MQDNIKVQISVVERVLDAKVSSRRISYSISIPVEENELKTKKKKTVTDMKLFFFFVLLFNSYEFGKEEAEKVSVQSIRLTSQRFRRHHSNSSVLTRREMMK